MENTDIFVCETCKTGLEMSRTQVVEHLKDEHGLTELKGNRQMLMHLDGKDWFQSVYKWTFGEVVLTENSMCARRKHDQW